MRNNDVSADETIDAPDNSDRETQILPMFHQQFD
jgi:hypothetical protein